MNSIEPINLDPVAPRLDEYWESIFDADDELCAIFEDTLPPPAASAEAQRQFAEFEASLNETNDPNNEKGALLRFALQAWADAIADPTSGINVVELIEAASVDQNPELHLGRQLALPCVTSYPHVVDELFCCLKDILKADLRMGGQTPKQRIFDVTGGTMTVFYNLERKVTHIELVRKPGLLARSDLPK